MKVVPQLDTYPELVDFAQTPAGKLCVILCGAILLRLLANVYWIEIPLIAGVMAFFPERRRILLSAAALYWLVFHVAWMRLDFIEKVAFSENVKTGPWLKWTIAAVLILGFSALAAFLYAIRRYPRSVAGRRPVLILVLLYFSVLGLAGAIPVHGPFRLLIWMIIALFGPYLWYFCYAAADSKSKSADPFVLQFGTFFPFWAGGSLSATPIGKGAAYLRKVESREPKDLAITQLKAIKLMIWTLMLVGVLVGFYSLVYEAPRRVAGGCAPDELCLPNLGVPTLETALTETAAGVPVPLIMAWASVLSHFITALLQVAVSGNVIVACCRMAGFRILRNTYKPLYATSIAEFWNRFYYYFKELLVEFFFFPIYVRYFKSHPRLRLAAATIGAATLGNMLYHFGRDYHYVFEMGLWNAIAGFQVYVFYTLILGVTITISQMRGKRAGSERPTLYRRVASSAGVIAFYCLLEIFDYEPRSHTLQTHLVFFCNLFPFTKWIG